MIDRSGPGRFRDPEEAERVRRTGWLLGGAAIAMALVTALLILGPWSPDPAELERALATDSTPSAARPAGATPSATTPSAETDSTATP